MRLLLFIFMVLLLSCCQEKNPDTVSYYHWKSRANLDDSEKATLDSFGVKNLYLRYFDVVYDEFLENSRPTYFLDMISYRVVDMEITPVVYIENEVLKKGSVAPIADKIKQLVKKISTYHFKEAP